MSIQPVLLKSFAIHWKDFLVQQQKYKNLCSSLSLPQQHTKYPRTSPVPWQRSGAVSAAFPPALHQNVAEEAEVAQEVENRKR